jgi:hypothetical protein
VVKKWLFQLLQVEFEPLMLCTVGLAMEQDQFLCLVVLTCTKTFDHMLWLQEVALPPKN